MPCYQAARSPVSMGNVSISLTTPTAALLRAETRPARLLPCVLLAALLSGPHRANALEGGRPDTEDRYAAVVVLVAGPTDQCSASKIDARRFLTAAHCVVNTASGELRPAFRAGGHLANSNASTPCNAQDFVTVAVVQTRLAPAFRTGMERFIAFKRERVAALQEQFAGTELPRRIAEMEAKHHFTARYPDVALVRIDRATPSIPTVSIDFDKVAAEETVTLVGYGCARLADRQDERRRLPFGRRRWARTQIIRVDAVNFYSYAEHLRADAPSLCPGDSGGPVLRAGKVVGVHGTVYGISAAGGAHSNMSVNLHALRDWEALRDRSPAVAPPRPDQNLQRPNPQSP